MIQVSNRETQAWAYRNIRDSGLLSRLRFLVFEVIYEQQDLGPEGVTSGELDRRLSTLRATWSRSASPRLIELVRLGVIEELDPRECQATGQRVIAYKTTGRLPDRAALVRRVGLSREDKACAAQALRYLWQHVAPEDRPVVRKLGVWLTQSRF